MEKTCRTCDYWLVTGKGKYGKAMFPGSWGTERRDTENRRCRCVSCYVDNFKSADYQCGLWYQASDIIDECEHCGALLFEYDRPPTPGSKREHTKGTKVRFWDGGDNECEHSGLNYHGNDPWTCGMCQGTGREWVKDIGAVQCDACHGKGEID